MWGKHDVLEIPEVLDVSLVVWRCCLLQVRVSLIAELQWVCGLGRGGCARVIDHMTFAYALAIKTSRVQCMMATSTTSVCDLCGESNDEHLSV